MISKNNDTVPITVLRGGGSFYIQYSTEQNSTCHRSLSFSLSLGLNKSHTAAVREKDRIDDTHTHKQTMASSSGNIFVDCAALQQQDGVGGEDATINIMQCVSDTYQDTQDDRDANLRSFLLVVCGGMIFFMQSGFAMMCAGSVRLKNVQNTMLKNLLDACGAALAFYLVGAF